MPKEINASQFESEVLETSKTQPVLVDFYAQWCMPCKMMSPILDNLEHEMGEEIAIIKVDVDQERGLAGEFGIMSIPTMYVFRDGKVVDKVIGMQTIDQLKQTLSKHK